MFELFLTPNTAILSPLENDSSAALKSLIFDILKVLPLYLIE